MKWTATLPPAAALIAGLLWTGRERQVLHGLQDDQDLLRKCIAAAQRGEAGGAGDHERAVKGAISVSRKKIDWKKVLEMQAAQSSGMPDMRLMMELQRNIMEMSEEEMLAQIDEIEGMDASSTAKVQLESLLIEALSEKNPALVLEKFSGWMSKGQWSWQLSSAFQKLSKQDQGAAIQWLDRKIAEGVFESKSLDGRDQQRLQFEASLLSEMAGTDSKAAQARLMSLPEDQRASIFQTLSYQAKPGSEAALAAMARATVPADQEPQAVANLTSQIRGDFTKLDQFIDTVSPTSQEREAIVKEGFEAGLYAPGSGTLDASRLDAARAWAAKQSPGVLDTATGNALGRMGKTDDFAANSQLAVKYAAQSSGDDLMTAFLNSSSATNNAAQALTLVDKINDPAARDQIRQRLEALAQSHAH